MLDLFRAVFAPPRDLILLVLAGWLGLALTDRRARQSAVGEKAIDTLVGIMAVAFVIGGRVFFLVGHLSAYVSSPVSIVSLNTAAFDMWGGLICSVIAAGAVIQRRGLPAWETLDLLAPFFATLSLGLGLSHLASGAAFGKETAVPWAIFQWGAERHPTQIYELIAETATLCTVWFWRPNRKAGMTFLLWVTLAAASRLILEGFRGDSTLIFGGIRLAQLAAWLIMAAAIVCLEVLRREPNSGPVSLPAEPPAPEKQRRTVPRKDSAP